MRKHSKKLVLGKETVRNLNPQEMKGVGGYSDYDCTFTSCYQECSCKTHCGCTVEETIAQ